MVRSPAEIARLFDAARAARPSVAETRARLRAVRSCPYRSSDLACGCNGSRCALRGGAIVGHRDCLDCVTRFPDPA